MLFDSYFTPSQAFVLPAGETCTGGNTLASKCQSLLLLHQLLLSNTPPCCCIFILLPSSLCLFPSPLFVLNVLFCAREMDFLCLYTAALLELILAVYFCSFSLCSSVRRVVCFCFILWYRLCQDLPPLTLCSLQQCFGKQGVRRHADC